MIEFKLTPTHFAELAWAKMRITAFGRPKASVPDLVRLLNLERAMLDAQQFEAHRLADLVMDEAPEAAAKMRVNADERYRLRWKQLGELISALGGVADLVDVDWVADCMMSLRLDEPLAFDPARFAEAQAQQIDMAFLGPDWDFMHAAMIALIRGHKLPASLRSEQMEQRRLRYIKNRSSQDPQTPPQAT